jgi:hypothetical protein
MAEDQRRQVAPVTRTYQLGVSGHALTVDAEEIVAYERTHNPVIPS